MVIVALAGRLPGRLASQSFRLYVLILLMYVTASIRTVAPLVAGFHPLVGMILFGAAVRVAIRAWEATFETP